MLVIIIPVRWFRVQNAGLTRNRLENWVYGPARPAGLGCFWTVECWSDQHLAGHLGYIPKILVIFVTNIRRGYHNETDFLGSFSCSIALML